MSTAEWAIVFGLVGAVTGVFSLFWRIFEWWAARRIRVKVTTSVEQFWPATYPGQFVPVDRSKLEGYLIQIKVINKGRPITIDSAPDSVGFLDTHSGRQYAFVAHPGTLPARLPSGEFLDVLGDPGDELRVALTSGAKIVPYCKDSEGYIHKAKYDRHFHEEARRLIAEYPEVMHE